MRERYTKIDKSSRGRTTSKPGMMITFMLLARPRDDYVVLDRKRESLHRCGFARDCRATNARVFPLGRPLLFPARCIALESHTRVALLILRTCLRILIFFLGHTCPSHANVLVARGRAKEIAIGQPPWFRVGRGAK